MKKIFTILFFFPFLVNAQNNLDFQFDYAQFSYDTTSNFVEFYYSVNQAALQLSEKDNHFLLEGVLKIFVQNQDNMDTVINNQWKINQSLNDTSSMNKQMLIGTMGFILPQGTLKYEVSCFTLENKDKPNIISGVMDIKPFVREMSISDIQLASKMIQGSDNTGSMFYKNTYEVTPVPNVLFGNTQPAMFFYTELYNLQSKNIKSDILKLDEAIYNSRGKQVKEKSKYISKNTNSRVEVGAFILNNYPTDTYTLTIALIDSSGSKASTSSKRFFVYNPDVQVSDTFQVSATSSISSMFGAMSEEELDDIYQKSKYIATSSEIDKYKKLNTLEGKRTFIDDFWKYRDANPSTPENEYFKDYLQRIEIANERYTHMGKIGWKTDRGRVYLLYGEPSEIERYPNQLETKPYEIWHYNSIEGGVYFVFADLTGFSDYVLVHSTKRGEISDEDWSRRITVN